MDYFSVKIDWNSAQDLVCKEISVYLTVLFICIQQSGYLGVPMPGLYFLSDNITVIIVFLI